MCACQSLSVETKHKINPIERCLSKVKLIFTLTQRTLISDSNLPERKFDF